MSMRIFKKFHDQGEAKQFAEFLDEAGIEFELETYQSGVDHVILGQGATQADHIIKIALEDFPKAQEIMDDLARMMAEKVREDHYLFSFDEDELEEIIEKPDEWSRLDYFLAIRILKSRGKEIDQEELEQFKETRLSEQKKGTSVSVWMFVTGYIAAAILWFGPLLYVWPFLLSIFVMTMAKTLPDGKRYYFYDSQSRKRAKHLLIFASASFFVWLTIFLTWDFT